MVREADNKAGTVRRVKFILPEFESPTSGEPQGYGGERQDDRKDGHSVISAVNLACEPMPEIAWFWGRIVCGLGAIYCAWRSWKGLKTGEFGDCWFGAQASPHFRKRKNRDGVVIFLN